MNQKEVNKDFVSLTEMDYTLSDLNLFGSLANHKKLLVGEMVKKDKALDFAQASLSATRPSLFTAQGDLENFHLENISLAKETG